MHYIICLHYQSTEHIHFKCAKLFLDEDSCIVLVESWFRSVLVQV